MATPPPWRHGRRNPSGPAYPDLDVTFRAATQVRNAQRSVLRLYSARWAPFGPLATMITSVAVEGDVEDVLSYREAGDRSSSDGMIVPSDDHAVFETGDETAQVSLERIR